MTRSRMIILTGLTTLAAAAIVAPPSHADSLLPLEVQVPFEPTAFPSDGRTYLCYELYLTNFSGNAIELRRLEVLDDDDKSATPFATFEGGQLTALLQMVGPGPPKGSSPAHLAGGTTAVAFMWVSFERGARVPQRMRHRVTTADSNSEGARIGTHHEALQVLGPPVEGVDWHALDGPNNDPDNHHRRGILVFEGRPQISRRYATDWVQEKDGAAFSGDEHTNPAYFSYGKPVLAVADATVLTARDGLPDNVPGYRNEQFHAATLITPETVAGNTITLDLGKGQFAHYAHLQPGSVRVKTGDHVHRGQVIARIGCSGDARAPHLHFQVTTASSGIVSGEGVPYVIDQFRLRSTAGTVQTRTRELPLGGMLVDFGQP
jgi:peptidase M23-like protein